ncbi:hypothetical protein Tsubulata_007210 [Turnera subulata]|uniref:S-protein homolog n=1 Tax=Turnera subulata TaxID=218843 RepID=A0A9Q0J1U8_9ROSI|nr:hypothetical protein Tsubulata_007210 [Turnera subulata]
MSSFTNHRLLLPLLTLSLLLFTTPSCAKHTIEVVNVVLGYDLNLQCKSKLGDVGPRNLYSGEHFLFEVEGSTQCHFWWGETGKYSHWFEIYKPSRDKVSSYGPDYNEFKWGIKLEGPCFNNLIKMPGQEICYPWN